MSLYSPMTEKDSTEELLHDCQSGDDDGTVYNIKARPALPTRWITTTVSLTAAGTLLGLLVGFLIGQSASRTSKASGLFHASFPASAPQIPDIGYVQRTFQMSAAFSQTPPSEDAPEPIWDSLVPEGLGYFKDDVLAPNVSLPTAIHQLHCLYIVRRAFFSGGMDGNLTTSDLGKSRAIHVPHCFDYLQQTITCAADGTVEPGVDTVNKRPGRLFTRTCRDYEGLKAWLSAHRVFDAHGFLAYTDREGHQHD